MCILSTFVLSYFFFFFFNDTATTEIYTLSLHDALPISTCRRCRSPRDESRAVHRPSSRTMSPTRCARSEEHTSELQSQSNLVCRLLLEKKKQQAIHNRQSVDKKIQNVK